MNSARMVFLISFLPAIASSLGLFIGGTYDDLPTRKLVAAFILAAITGAVNGLLAIRALNTEPKPPPPPSPPAP